MIPLIRVALAVLMTGTLVPFVANGATTETFQRISPCPFAAAANLPQERLVCGYLEVPESRELQRSATIRIPVVVIRSTSATPLSDPIVFLHGGPGAAPLESSRSLEGFARHPFGAQRDIILYNQRGSAQNEPALECEALRSGRIGVYADDLTLPERDQRIAAQAIECLKQVSASGRDLRAYSAVDNAHDLLALRRALGIPHWNLLAVSYGTLMALEAARVDPQGVRSMVLDSIVSPRSDLFMAEGPRNFSQGLDRLLDACAADRACCAAFPELRNRLRTLLAGLTDQPVKVTVAGESDAAPVDIVVNWHDFLNLIHWMLYNWQTLRLVPVLIDETARGDLRLLTTLADRVFPAPRNGSGGSSPAFHAIVCRDQYTARNPLPLVAGNPDYRNFSIVSFMNEVCASQVVGKPLKPAPVAIASDVPTLLISGRFDPMTPQIYAQQAASALSRATRLVIPDSGHSTISNFDSCQTRAASRFFDDPGAKLAGACAAEPPPQFVLDREAAEQLLIPAK